MLISLVARRALEYEGTLIPAGTRFDVPPIAAAVLRYQRVAEFAPPGFPPPAAPVQAAVVPVRQADEAEAPKRRGRKPKTDGAREADAPAPARRQYRRRNLTAEPT